MENYSEKQANQRLLGRHTLRPNASNSLPTLLQGHGDQCELNRSSRATDSVHDPSTLSFSDQLATLTLDHVISQDGHIHQQQRQRTPSLFSLNDLKLVTTVGAGTFGRVELVQDMRRERVDSWYALKKMRIKSVIALKQVTHVLSEREILTGISCPFIVKLYWTWRDKVNLYLLMEYVPGGELFSHLRSSYKFNEPKSRFYAAEIVYTFVYLHSQNIIYRDLKPENVLIGNDGHIKLTDFGFAKRIRDRTWTLCGTPEYLSPEVILNRGHGKAVDWWSLGILIYEMLVGTVPFGPCETPVEVYECIIRGQIRYNDIAGLSAPARDIIQGLLQVDRTRRLGNMRDGERDVKNHLWFKDVNWDDIAAKRVEPPWLPLVHHNGDPSNYEEYEPEEPIQPDEIFDEAYLMEGFGSFAYSRDGFEVSNS